MGVSGGSVFVPWISQSEEIANGQSNAIIPHVVMSVYQLLKKLCERDTGASVDGSNISAIVC